jgi:hypothetical protein
MWLSDNLSFGKIQSVSNSNPIEISFATIVLLGDILPNFYLILMHLARSFCLYMT